MQEADMKAVKEASDVDNEISYIADPSSPLSHQIILTPRSLVNSANKSVANPASDDELTPDSHLSLYPRPTCRGHR